MNLLKCDQLWQRPKVCGFTEGCMTKGIMVTLHPLTYFSNLTFRDFLKIAAGDSDPFPRLVETMASAAGIKAPHRQNLKKADHEPVTHGGAMKIQRFRHSNIPDKQFLKELEVAAEPWNALQLKTDGTSWMSALAGVERSKIGAEPLQTVVIRRSTVHLYMVKLYNRQPESDE